MKLKKRRITMKKYKVGFVCGFFDIIHDGHINILKYAKAQCDKLIVAVGTDEFMKIRKGRKPVLTYYQRVRILQSIKYVDEVVPENDLDKIAAYKKYRFDAMFAGDDHIDEKVYIESTRILKEKFGVDTIYVKRNDMSSSKLRKCAYDIYKINEKLYD